MSYPHKTFLINTLLDIAGKAARESSADHPGDIANAMIFAIESGAETLTTLHRNAALHASCYAEHAEPQPPIQVAPRPRWERG